MNAVIVMLLAFIGLGLGSMRIGRLSFLLMVAVIALYVGYVYVTG